MKEIRKIIFDTKKKTTTTTTTTIYKVGQLLLPVAPNAALGNLCLQHFEQKSFPQ